MKIVVVGGSGLIGKRVVDNLRGLGHEVVSASPRSGVNSITGEGLTEALAGAQVIVDVSNSPSFAEQAVLEFFETSTGNLLAAGAGAGVRHYVALSVVGAERLPDSGYMRAKVAQEKLIKESHMPYTILRATQFFEFLEAIAGSGSVDGEIRMPKALMQPIAAENVSDALTEIAVAAPVNDTVELGGPEAIPMDDLIRRYLTAKHDARHVTTDDHARYFGAEVDDRSLTPGSRSRLGSIHLDEWLSRHLTAG
jgi:uncharacterized protein YbjT (DUF2867 family)